ncbi:MAG: GNAT family N-acetyltransferase [Spirochaetales bacterium]|nr:GNAT family N-acetyltransferase [Spirochaetales bacterium]
MRNTEDVTRHRSVELAPAGDPSALAAEVASCERVAVVGRLEVYDFEGDAAPTLMREIGRIREREYRAIGAGRGGEIDVDRYDAAPHRYRQIVVWDPQHRQLVAMYRYAWTREVLETVGLEGLRTHTMFAFSKTFELEVLSSAVELGRSVVNSEASAAIRGLHAVWFGLASIVERNPSIAYYFGNVTIPATMPPEAIGHILAMLRTACAPGDGLTFHDVAARGSAAQPSIPADADGYVLGDHRGALALLRERLAPYEVMPPPILMSYLKRSTRLWAFESARDEDFGDALETALVMPVATITDEARRLFFGAEKE